MDPLFLLVDSGNTNIKWALHDGLSWLQKGAVAQEGIMSLAQEWQKLREPSCIMVSDVAGDEAKAELSMLFSRWNVEPRWASAVAYQCGVRNYYANPAQLGSDRWAALIAAWQMERQGCLVVDTGTAMTVDALSDTGEFLGGIITPGFDLMRKTLIGNTAVSNEDEGEFCDYPDSTADAMYSGTTHAMAGAVERMATLLANTLGHPPVCILSGGGAQRLQWQLSVPVKVIENLVLVGLFAIAQENPETPQ
jgi:type III pantothenate kinase